MYGLAVLWFIFAGILFYFGKLGGVYYIIFALGSIYIGRLEEFESD